MAWRNRVRPSLDLSINKGEQFWPWLILMAGLVFLYAPVIGDLFGGLWSTDENAHGPVILIIALWLLHRSFGEVQCFVSTGGGTQFGWPVTVFGLLCFVLGRSQEILILEIGSLVWVFAGVILCMYGWKGLKAAWFPLFFMIFMIPLPGQVVDAVTMPMKTAVSYVAEDILFRVGYPIARSGVVLQIGQYKLLVADACAGLHTLFTLEALGLLYLNIVKHDSFARNITLAILIVPISFAANVIRVIVLSLITYHFGDEAGQGFLHGFAGMVLFLSALLLIIAVDSVVRVGVRKPVEI